MDTKIGKDITRTEQAVYGYRNRQILTQQCSFTQTFNKPLSYLLGIGDIMVS